MNDVAPTEFLEAPRAREWGWFKRFCFQAALIYSLLFTVPMMLGYFPSLTVLPHQQKAFEERQQARTAAARAAESRPSAAYQPAASQPAASQPAASQPAASQPAASQPAASQPAASQSAASRPTAAVSDDAPNAIVNAAGVALGKWSGWRRAAVDWTAEHGAQALIRCGLVREDFMIAIVVQSTGSGDTMINYVACFIEAVIALVVSLVWTVLGVAVGASSRLHGALAGFLEWLLRWFLFMVMVPWYGFAKLIPTQFSHPRMDSLMMRWDESSMMGVVWRFMGLSMPYTIFSGAAEVLGGILLVWRKTSTLGALVVLAVMTNVAFLNYCYDVPVKLYSSHYLVMAMGLAWLDRDRLIGFFFRNRDVAPRAFEPFLGTRFTDRAATVFKVLLVLWACWLDLSSSLKMREQMKERFSSAPLHGIFDVEAFRRDGVEVAPLTTDATRWRNLILEFKNTATVRMTNDAFVRYGFKSDSETKTVVLTRSLGPDQPVVTDKLLWSTPEPDVLLFEGTLDGKPVSIKARKRDLSKAPEYTLHNPGFRWVAEFPYNR